MADDAVTPKPEAVAPMMSVNLEDAEAPNETAVGASDGGGDEEALLMSGVTVDLVDWPKKARPMECTLLALSAILLLVGLLGDDWVFESLSGTQNHAGLAGTTGPSGFSCVRTVGGHLRRGPSCRRLRLDGLLHQPHPGRILCA